MKKIAIAAAVTMLTSAAFGQINEGKIVYERTMQMNIQVADNDPRVQNMIPRERKDQFELIFAQGKSLWKPAETEQNDDMSFGDEGGSRIVIRMMGADDVSYTDINTSKRVELRELGGKNFIITDSIRRLNWKVTGETRTILGHKCIKAVTQRTQESFRMQMDNGNATRQRVVDTLNIVAWFTNEIPGSYGPDIYQGQLPGSILEINVNNGNNVYTAIRIDKKADFSEIKEPSKGKKLTPAEFAQEREKLFQEMQQNGGPRRSFNIRS